MNNIKKSHLFLIPRVAVDDSLKLFDSVQRISLCEAEKLLLDNRNLYINGKSVSIPELCAVEKACILTKRTSVSNSNKKLSCEIDEMLIQVYTIRDFLCPAIELIRFYYSNYYGSELNDLTEELLEMSGEKYGINRDVSEDINNLSYLKKAEEIYESLNNHEAHWCAIINYAVAHKRMGNLEKALNLGVQAELLVNNQYSKVDKRINPILCFPEYEQGNIKLMTVLDNLTNDNLQTVNFNQESDKSKVLNLDALKIAEKKFLNLQRLKYSSSEFSNRLGIIQGIKHNFGESLLYFADSIELDMNNTYPWVNSYYVLLRYNKYNEALSILNHIYLIKPDSQEFFRATHAYEKATGMKVKITSQINSVDLNFTSNQEKIKNNAERCLMIVKDINWLKTDKIEAQKTQNAVKLVRKAYDVLNSAISGGVIEEFLTAEEILFKSGKIQTLIETKVAFFKLYYEMGFYELCFDVYENLSYEYRNLIPEDKIKKVNYYIENPSEYISEAKRSVKSFSRHWGSYSTLGHAYLLAALRENDLKSRSGLLNKSYKSYSEAQSIFNDYFKKKQTNLNKSNNSKGLLTPFMCRPLFGQGYVKFIEFEDGLKSEAELELLLIEAHQKLTELYDIGYENSDLFYALGHVSYAYNDKHTAFEFLNSAIELNPENINAWIEYAIILLNEVGVEAAKPYLKVAMEIDHKNKKLLDLSRDFKIDLSKLD